MPHVWFHLIDIHVGVDFRCATFYYADIVGERSSGPVVSAIAPSAIPASDLELMENFSWEPVYTQ